ncbi:MAG: hypothetical protein JSS49_11065 [Planctomycetes bacterium]|nr:hypothetical protein [Planctomycetota bacterium]
MKSRNLVWSVVVFIFTGSLVSGDDAPPAKATVTADQQAAFATNPVIKKANAAFEAEMKTAETVFSASKRKATEKRLAVYREQLKTFTKSGDFDRAMACKAAIDGIETNPSETSVNRPRPKDVVRFEGHTYALIREPATWHMAKRRCEEMGGHLAFVKGGKEYGFLYKLCGKTRAYLGASDEEQEGQWRWLDGTLWTPNPWETDNGGTTMAPQHYMSLDGGRNVMDDIGGSERLAYICEWDD